VGGKGRAVRGKVRPRESKLRALEEETSGLKRSKHDNRRLEGDCSCLVERGGISFN